MPKNQTSFQPGNNANPNGRPPKDWTMSSLIREASEEADETGEPKNKIIARKLTEKAVKGDLMAIKEFINRLDGMPKQAIEHGGELKLLPLIPVNEIRSNNSDNQDIESN